ncbi:MAG: sugar phosphate isomerase/epimerase [Clostridia bacterium]|nr:sugar phosphate isomerase/epimerase [Clostridia bacterium]
MLISVTVDDIFKKYGAANGCKLIKDCGFTAVDWSFFESIGEEAPSVLEKSYDEIKAYYKPQIDAIRENGLEIALAHAPFPAYKAEDPEYMYKCIEVYKKVIMLCDEVDCPYLVVHGISRKFSWDLSCEEIDELNMELYTSLIPTLLQTNVKVCLENLFTHRELVEYAGHCCNPREANHWVDRLNDIAGMECFAICLDSGHATLTNTSIRHYIEICGKRIQALHLHDNSGNDDNHALPYTGKTDWDGLCHFLGLVGYEGAINFELSFDKFEPEMEKPALEFTSAAGRAFERKIKEARAKC